jgi:hypothetical protein
LRYETFGRLTAAVDLRTTRWDEPPLRIRGAERDVAYDEAFTDNGDARFSLEDAAFRETAVWLGPETLP